MQNTSWKWYDRFCTAATQPQVVFEIVALTSGPEEAIQHGPQQRVCVIVHVQEPRICGNNPATAMRNNAQYGVWVGGIGRASYRKVVGSAASSNRQQ
jgi:hypothetical protein